MPGLPFPKTCPGQPWGEGEEPWRGHGWAVYRQAQTNQQATALGLGKPGKADLRSPYPTLGGTPSWAL